jgi:peptide/nickel transport system permease protein
MAVALPAARQRRMSPGLGVLREIVRRPAGLFGLLVVGALLVIIVLAAPLAPYDPAQQDVANRLQGPSGAHVLGTDQLGRDLLSRLLYGTRIALGVAVPAVLAALLAGLLLGMIAGYRGGRVDSAMVIVMDTLQAIPSVPLALILISLLGPSLRNVIAVIAVTFTPGYARVTRALVLAAKQNQYVETERALGAGDLRIALVHVLPNITAPLFILLAMDIPTAIAVESGLSFLGLGVQPPTPSWGVILAEGFERVRDTPWPVLWASLALMVTTLGFTMLGETLRDILDPRIAGVRRWRRP